MIRSTLQVLSAITVLIVGMLVLGRLPKSVVAAWIGLCLPIAVGFIGGLRARKAATQGAAAAAFGYLALLVYSLYRVNWNLPPDGDTPCIPIGSTLIMALFGALGGSIASKVLPAPLEAAPTNLCPACGYDLTGNVSGRCPECGQAATDMRSLAKADSKIAEDAPAGRADRRDVRGSGD